MLRLNEKLSVVRGQLSVARDARRSEALSHGSRTALKWQMSKWPDDPMPAYRFLRSAYCSIAA